MTNTGASVTEIINPKLILGGSLAEHFFHLPVNGAIKCDMCGITCMELVSVGDSAVFKIMSKHYGQKHWSIIPIEKLGLRLA